MRGVVGRAEGLADLAEGFVLEVTEQDGGAVGLIEGLHRFVEQGFDVCPVGGRGVQGIHLGGDFFAKLPTRFASNPINGRPACDLIKPGGQNRVWFQLVGIPRQVGEHGLRDLFGDLRRAYLAQGRRINQVQMPADQRRESFL